MRENLCKKCGKCCGNIPVDFDKKIVYRDGIQVLTPEFQKMLSVVAKYQNVTFCNCIYLKNALCTNPNKPDECKNYPSSPFAFLPEDCAYEGEIFTLNEQVKQEIRKLKEELLDLDAYLDTTDSIEEKNKYKQIIESHNKKINEYKSYGSDNW